MRIFTFLGADFQINRNEACIPFLHSMLSLLMIFLLLDGEEGEGEKKEIREKRAGKKWDKTSMVPFVFTVLMILQFIIIKTTNDVTKTECTSQLTVI